MMRLLSLEAERIMSGNFGLVDNWVTQPLWPLRVPRSTRLSLILALTSTSLK